MQYYQVFISAEQTAQAHRILDALIARQLVFGGPVVGGPAKFLWNFKDSDVPESLREPRLYTLEQDYKYIISYTREDLKEELVEVAEAAALEEVCMISFLPMEPNRSLRLRLSSRLGRSDIHLSAPSLWPICLILREILIWWPTISGLGLSGPPSLYAVTRSRRCSLDFAAGRNQRIRLLKRANTIPLVT